MLNDLLDFIARIAWPLVALIGVLILGPGGLLQKIVGELSEKLFRITDAIGQFKETANDFHKTVNGLKESTTWVGELRDQLLVISVQLQGINSIAQQLVISEASRALEKTVGEENPNATASPAAMGKSPDEMFDDLRDRWDSFTQSLGERVGNDFDARSVGKMAWKLVDRRRAKPLTESQAALIETLHSQMKRFNRLQSNKDEWLTHDIYAAFVRGIEQASEAIA